MATNKPTPSLPEHVTVEYLKRVEVGASACARLAALQAAIKAAKDELAADMMQLPCPESATAIGESGNLHTGQTEEGQGQPCYKDGRWHERRSYFREPDFTEEFPGYCAGCLRRIPLARKLKRLRSQRGGVIGAVVAAGKKLFAA